jgi:hypothetical protein
MEMKIAEIRVIDWLATRATGMAHVRTIRISKQGKGRIFKTDLNLFGMPTNLSVHYIVGADGYLIPHEFLLAEAMYNGMNTDLPGLN